MLLKKNTSTGTNKLFITTPNKNAMNYLYARQKINPGRIAGISYVKIIDFTLRRCQTLSSKYRMSLLQDSP
jgi:hypothetical protein